MQEVSIENALMPTITITELQTANYQLIAPFVLHCDDNAIVCQSILRHLPGKRLTCVADFNGKIVLLKLFYSPMKRHVLHAKIDKQGSQKLTAAGIRTPGIIATQISLSTPYSFVAYEYLVNAMSLRNVWRQTTDELIHEKLLLDLIQVITKLHQQGLWQADLHFDNFLNYNDTYYVVDGAAIKGAVAKPLSNKTCLQNIGLLLAHIKRSKPDFIAKASAAYLTARGWQHCNAKKYFAQQRWQHECNYLARTMRSCSDYVRIINLKQRIIFLRSALGKAAQEHLQQAISGKTHEPLAYLKQGNSSTLMKISLQQEDLVLKRYNLKHCWHALRRACQPSRAANTWQFGHLLQLLGIATPKPIAFAEKRWWIFRRQAYVVYPYCQGVTLDCYIQANIDNAAKWQTALQQTITILVLMAQAGLIHHDLKASNFLVTDTDVQLLDLDAMQRISSKSRLHRLWQKDKQRFLANFSEHDKIGAYCRELFKQVNL